MNCKLNRLAVAPPCTNLSRIAYLGTFAPVPEISFLNLLPRDRLVGGERGVGGGWNKFPPCCGIANPNLLEIVCGEVVTN